MIFFYSPSSTCSSVIQLFFFKPSSEAEKKIGLDLNKHGVAFVRN